MNWPDYGEKTPKVFFLDVDGTLHPGTTAYFVALEMKSRGLVQGSFFLRSAWYGLQHRFGRLDYGRLLDHAIETLQRVPIIDLERMGYDCFARDVKPNLFPGVLDHLDEMRRRGARLVLVSSSLRHTLESLKIFLRAEEVIGTPLIEKRGFIVSRGPGPVCYGPGKLHWARQWCGIQGVDPADCVAYGDNYSDRHLMEGVGRAVAVRPKRNLRKYARKKGWTIVE